MELPVIVLICGPPAVGKTTVAGLLQSRLEDRGLSVDVLDSDQFTRNTYDRLYERVVDAETHLIVAGTFYKRQWQERFQRLDDVVVVYLHADKETCIERNRQRADAIDERAVHIVWDEFDQPDADITVDVTEQSPQAIVDHILSALPAHTRAVHESR
ncbi:AAA family ATPase [Halorientalis salina]|uniref:AAA family ATPase n=1 Tax=Halorientalis salina TaxID=2932266 RepID=UPI00145DC4A9|nr:AAA family ATPase [Halorientalis salina]